MGWRAQKTREHTAKGVWSQDTFAINTHTLRNPIPARKPSNPAPGRLAASVLETWRNHCFSSATGGNTRGYGASEAEHTVSLLAFTLLHIADTKAPVFHPVSPSHCSLQPPNESKGRQQE